MKLKITSAILGILTLLLTSCVDDVNSIPPRNVTLIYNWEASNIAGLDSGFIRITHQAGAAELVLKSTQEKNIIKGVIGNLVVHETPDIQEEGTAVVDKNYIIPIEKDTVEITFIIPDFQ